MRACGECQLCCTLLSVQAIGKPMNTRCVHAVGGCCAIYADRPSSCREFDCLWLLGFGTDDQRPDRSHAVPTLINDGDLVIHEEAGFVGIGRAAWADLMERAWDAGRRVFWVIGESPMRLVDRCH